MRCSPVIRAHPVKIQSSFSRVDQDVGRGHVRTIDHRRKEPHATGTHRREVGGSVALYRDGTFLGSARVQYTNRSYAYKLNVVTCVPGNYHAMGYAYANFDGGAADIFHNVTTPTVAITCT